ncbi:MAG TPA: inositol monophosphatase family protein [Candidatus Limnocylindrales bacterium]|nr:inositol monophosphatase family protein [Candidatus Limnocylindrales bacterium]
MAEPAAASDRAQATGRGFDAELALAVNLAHRAGELQMARYERVERIDFKSAKDVVTEVDHLSEALILEGIRERFPDDAFLGEETGGHDAKAGTTATSGIGRAWVIDPLDGTINYANGIPFFCVSIALVEAGRPVVGVIHDPTRGETFAAAAGTRAARLNGLEVQPSAKDRLSDFVISMALSGRAVASRVREVRRAVRVARSMGSAALALVYVANGRFDAFVQQGGLSTWDIAAAGFIAETSGALVTDLSGGPWFDVGRSPRSIGLLAAPSRHHPELLRLVAGK